VTKHRPMPSREPSLPKTAMHSIWPPSDFGIQRVTSTSTTNRQEPWLDSSHSGAHGDRAPTTRLDLRSIFCVGFRPEQSKKTWCHRSPTATHFKDKRGFGMGFAEAEAGNHGG